MTRCLSFGRINLCPVFWTAPTTGTDSKVCVDWSSSFITEFSSECKAGTLIHEASHFAANGRTFDYAYGQAAARALARTDPFKAIFNADSHEYFAENSPAECKIEA